MRRALCIVTLLLLGGGCRGPGHSGGGGETQIPSEAERPKPAELGNVSGATERPPSEPVPAEAVKAVVDEGMSSRVSVLAMMDLDYHEGRWRTVVVFEMSGMLFCSRVTDHGSECRHSEDIESPYVPWDAEDYLGVAIFSYEEPDQLRFEAGRMLPSGCSIDDFGLCGEDVDETEDDISGAGVQDLSVERLEIEDVDGDGVLEIVLEVGQVQLDPDYEFDEPSDDPRAYYEPSYNQRRLLVLRPNLSRQFDTVIHQEMHPLILGMYADRDIGGEVIELTPAGVQASWCEVEMNSGDLIRECMETVCATPTTRIELPYDASTDSYEVGEVEQLRPELDGTCETLGAR